MKKVKLGIVGAGNIARQHLEVINDIDFMQVEAVASRTRAKAEQLAADYKIKNCFDTLEEMLKAGSLDGLMILVSPEEMFSVVSRAITYGLPLFIEKPPALSLKKVAELVGLADRYLSKTMVGFNRRFYSVFHKGLEAIKAQGPLLAVSVTGHERMWRIRSGKKHSEQTMSNWIIANSTHTIDLLRFFGGDVSNLSSINHSYREKNGDQFSAIMELSCGAIGQYNSFWYSPGGWGATLYGDGLTVEFQPLEKGKITDKDFKVTEINPDEEDLKHKPGFYKQMKAFGELVVSGKSQWPAVNLKEAYQTVALAEKIAFSNQGGQI
ncbi:MAG: Gfo/Idh/MocA family oxidoreductase [Candidatus Omnitrophota bacterium]|jgi:predicted dehydrogenase